MFDVVDDPFQVFARIRGNGSGLAGRRAAPDAAAAATATAAARRTTVFVMFPSIVVMAVPSGREDGSTLRPSVRVCYELVAITGALLSTGGTTVQR